MDTASADTGSGSNLIQGRVSLPDGIGIPELVINLYDVDPHTLPEEVLLPPTTEARTAPLWSSPGDRLGSVITAEDGSFELAYDDRAYRYRKRDEQRPDLLLLVSGPEGPGIERQQRLLYLTSAIRQNAGRIESFLIVIPQELLERAGVLPRRAQEGSVRQIQRQAAQRPDKATRTSSEATRDAPSAIGRVSEQGASEDRGGLWPVGLR